jgi:hypothetical protein
MRQHSGGFIATAFTFLVLAHNSTPPGKDWQ